MKILKILSLSLCLAGMNNLALHSMEYNPIEKNKIHDGTHSQYAVWTAVREYKKASLENIFKKSPYNDKTPWEVFRELPSLTKNALDNLESYVTRGFHHCNQPVGFRLHERSIDLNNRNWKELKQLFKEYFSKRDFDIPLDIDNKSEKKVEKTSDLSVIFFLINGMNHPESGRAGFYAKSRDEVDQLVLRHSKGQHLKSITPEDKKEILKSIKETPNTLLLKHLYFGIKFGDAKAAGLMSDYLYKLADILGNNISKEYDLPEDIKAYHITSLAENYRTLSEDMMELTEFVKRKKSLAEAVHQALSPYGFKIISYNNVDEIVDFAKSKADKGIEEYKNQLLKKYSEKADSK